MYDPDKQATRTDTGEKCPTCGKNLMYVSVDVKPHPSGKGLAYRCPGCGEYLHENDWQYVFIDQQAPVTHG